MNKLSFTLKAGLAAALAASLMPSMLSGASGITFTKHNLSPDSNNSIRATGTQNNKEICVYCHTPHAADVGFDGAPLWNKKTPTTTITYTMYQKTIGGTTPDIAPANPSKACLSCHDGVSAINSIVNAPGSGNLATNYNGSLRDFNGTTAGNPYQMPNGITQIGDTNNSFSNAVNLSNDHPVSIAYMPGRGSLREKNASLVGVWAGGYTEVSQLLRGSNVECGSCHDPHEKDNATFLRRDNAGSALCLGCHAK